MRWFANLFTSYEEKQLRKLREALTDASLKQSTARRWCRGPGQVLWRSFEDVQSGNYMLVAGGFELVQVRLEKGVATSTIKCCYGTVEVANSDIHPAVRFARLHLLYTFQRPK